MTRYLLVAIPFLAAAATFLAGTTAQAQIPGPGDPTDIPPWAWSVMVWGLLAMVGALGAVLVGVMTRFSVGQLRRLDLIEKTMAEVREEVRSLHKLSEGIGTLHQRIDNVEKLCQLKHVYDGK
jgi:hypothetical protein